MNYLSGHAPELQYSFAVPNGAYEVRLHFAETYSGAFAVGRRIFSVQMEGATVLQNLDIYAEAGANTALVKTVSIGVTDGQLNITFLHGVENPFVNAIEIISSPVPSTPTNLSASGVSPTQVNLSWTASVDDIGVTGYEVERCQGVGCSNFVRIAAPAGTTYSDSGLVASTSYGYRVRARDGSNNYSNYSLIANATTQSGAPLAPVRVNAGGPAYTDPAGNAWSADTGFNTGTVTTVSASISGTSNPALYQSLRWDSATAPELQYSFVVPNDSYQVRLHFAETYSGAFAIGRRIFSVQMEGATVLQNLDVYAEAGANAALIKTATVSVADGQLNIVFLHNVDNPFVNGIELIGQGTSDTQAPSTPAGLSATAGSGTQIDLSWSSSTDDVAVTGYVIERCQGSTCTDFAEIGSASSASYGDTGLTASTPYRYRVRAKDAANNLSAYSNVASAVTQSPGDAQAPTSPTGVDAIAVSSTQIQVSWSPSTDNVGVTGYLVERCPGAGCSNFTQVASLTTTSYSNTGLVPASTYSYRVRAKDAANNVSDYSTVASATTPITGADCD